MAKIGHIEIEVKPTVTLESACACVMMLNLFLDENEKYRLEVDDDSKWHLTDEPFVPATGGIRCDDVSSEWYGVANTVPLSNSANQDTPLSTADEECIRMAKLIEEQFKVKFERMA